MARNAFDRTHRRRLEQGEEGFSLIELLVVVALMALIGTMAIPSISNVFKISLGSTTRDLATTIRYAYNAAMMTKKVHRLVYDLKANRYWVEVGPPCTPEAPSSGFGHRMIAMSVKSDLKGTIERDWRPGGLTAVIRFPLES